MAGLGGHCGSTASVFLTSDPLTRSCLAHMREEGVPAPHPPPCCPARHLGGGSCVSVETQLKHVFPFRVLDWKATYVHGHALFLSQGRVCAIPTTRPTCSRCRLVHLYVCDMHTPARACMCPRVCPQVPRQPCVQACGPLQLRGACWHVTVDVPTDAPASSVREE